MKSPLWQLELQVPATKLRPPETQVTIEREALTAKLNKMVLNHQLTLISAPVGSGKTTIVADLVRSTVNFQTRWLSLNENDNDLQSFLLVIALAIFPNIENELLHMIHEGQVSSQQVATLLINRLDAAADMPIVIVLDDLHELTDTAILEFLDYFIEYAPKHVHLIAITRYDPALSLAKLRARNSLAELRIDALRFDLVEVDTLINGLLNLEISDTLIEQMLDRTEGWVAGIRLLSLSLSQINVSERQQYIKNLAQRDRYVFDLLAEEVLFQQPNEIRTFLLQTSILEELTLELCNAVTGQTDSHAKLAELHRNNLFLVSIGNGAYVYHSLFRNFLLEQLRRYHPHRLPELHRLAANAYTIPARKIHHFLVAEDWDAVIPLIGLHGRKLMEYSNRNIVLRWLEALPETYKTNDGWIIYLNGMMSYHRGDPIRTMEYMQQAEVWFQQRGNSEGAFEAIAMQLAASEEEHDLNLQLDFIHRMEPHITSDSQRMIRELSLGWNYLYHARRTEASEHFYEILTILESMPEKLGFVGFQLGTTMALVFDNLSFFQTRLQHLIDMFDLDTHVFHATARSLFATIAFWQGDLTQARQELDDSLAIWNKLGGINSVHRLLQEHLHVIIAWTENDNTQIDQLTAEYRNNPPHYMNLAMLRARWSWLLGDKSETRYILEHFPRFDDMENSLVGRPYYLSIDALLALDEGRFEAIESRLLEYIHHQQNSYSFYSLFMLDLRVTLAYCYLQIGLQQEAIALIHDLLRDYSTLNVPGRLAQEGGFVDPLLDLAIRHNIYSDFAQQVLKIRHPQQVFVPIDIAETGETLTAREAEVLQLIMEGASNQQIADTCFISIPTVKTHVSRILQKLNVSSRTQASAKARELRLFSIILLSFLNHTLV